MDKQTNWICPKDENFHTNKEILNLLAGKHCIHIEKGTKSLFKGNVDIIKELQNKNIEEVHIVGLDTNDCVLATAMESFDLGFFTYIIEECSETSNSEELPKNAMQILKHLNLTNNSCIEDIDFINI